MPLSTEVTKQNRKTKEEGTRTWASSVGTNRHKGPVLQTWGVTTGDAPWRVSVAQLKCGTYMTDLPSLLPHETLRAPSTANQKISFVYPHKGDKVKYSFPLKGNGGFCSFFKSLCSKQEKLHVVSSYALHVSNFHWSIHCSHFQNPGGGGTGQGASFCFLFNGYDPFLQSKFVLDGDKYVVLIHKVSGSWAQKAPFCIWDLQPWLHFLHSTIINNLSGMMQEPGTQRGLACEGGKRKQQGGMTEHTIQAALGVAFSKIPSGPNHFSMRHWWGPTRAFPTLSLSGNGGNSQKSGSKAQ